MWAALETGDPIGFVRVMKAGGYFTADEGTYAKAVAFFYKEFLFKIEGKSPPETALPEHEWSNARGFAALAIANAARESVDAAREGGP
jgi:bacillopeptidase F (M6 metalloprotease family)